MELETADSQKRDVASNTVSMAQAYATPAGGRFVQCFHCYNLLKSIGFEEGLLFADQKHFCK